MNEKVFKIELTWDEVMQVVSALESRQEAYEKTARFHRGEEVDILVEEVTDEEEATTIADGFRSTLDSVYSQYSQQKERNKE